MSTSKKPYVIVVGLDFSESGALVLERALELALAKPTPEIHVLNVRPILASDVTPDVVGAWGGAALTLSLAADELKLYVARLVNDFRARHRGAELGFLDGIRTHLRTEDAAGQITQLAADVDADLVVVGTHGRRGMARLILGSVAESTIRSAPCPVLVVRPKAPPVRPTHHSSDRASEETNLPLAMRG
jgi:nucleotide-binding universal stress UspA family protein